MSGLRVFPAIETAPGLFGPGAVLAATGASGTTAGGTWPSANLAIYVPLRITRAVSVAQLTLLNGAVVSGNVDVGLMDANFVRLASAGSTAQAGTNAYQTFNITDILIGPGLYYMAVALDNTTATVFRVASTISAEVWRALGLAQQAAAFPIPSVGTPAVMANNYLPLVGLDTLGTF